MARLHGFFRSGTSHRLRIALNLKGLPTEILPVNLRKGEHKAEAYLALNPQGFVPAYESDDDGVLTQSPAIIEYLEERYPDPPLLPQGLGDRARVRAMAAAIGCDIHPINNMRILGALRQQFGADEEAIKVWTSTWIHAGFKALERMLPEDVGQGALTFGDQPGLVECYLIPQVYSARRFDVDLSTYPKITALDAVCGAMEAFQAAHPDAQPDAV
ncbi:MAG: maleylacetoacetate isomerase [Rhodospirillum sp.]|nr:maleylacetoacetate isomerase [Rhodospirillum sp.]MCF8489766.1 maleylacetoacetate isomerase [Rhodospirillum sp.]MCF8501269.1 maleylacetoacetate isomerase [Rhodospirillum sp.]